MRRLLIIMTIASLGMTVLLGCEKENEEGIDAKVNIVLDESMIRVEEVHNTEIPECSAPQGDGGGNKYVNEGEAVDVKTISILVSENEYFCENAPIEFEEILILLEQMDEEVVVEVTDNKATYKAYDKLLDKLEELEVSVVEK